jgi:hypothetical protein
VILSMAASWTGRARLVAADGPFLRVRESGHWGTACWGRHGSDEIGRTILAARNRLK